MKTSITNVQTTIVSSEDGRHTYEVKKCLLNESGAPTPGSDAILIGLYPTTTSEEPYKTDLSTNHLVCKMQELGLLVRPYPESLLAGLCIRKVIRKRVRS